MHGQVHQKDRRHERLRKHIHLVLGLHEFLLPPWHEFLALRPEPIVPRGIIGPSSCPTMPVPNEVAFAVDYPCAEQSGALEVAKMLEGHVIVRDGSGVLTNVSRYR
jgi:hypothetical protein